MRVHPATKQSIALVVALIVAGCASSGGTVSPGASAAPTSTRYAAGATPSPLTGTFFPVAENTDLRVVKAAFFVYAGAPVEVLVTVENDGSGPVRFGPAAQQTFKLVAADGGEIGSGSLMPLHQFVRVGMNGYLGGWVGDLSADDVARIDHVEPSITFRSVPAEVVEAAEVLSIKAPMAQEDTSGHLVVRGRLTNNGPTTNGYGVVYVVLMDSDMTPIGWLRDDHTVPGLAAGASVVFTADSPTLPVSLLPQVFVSQAGAYDPV